jgi:hypothetical protein
LENRFVLHKSEVALILDKHHSENRVRLQNIDMQSVQNGNDLAKISVKLNTLYGEQGQPGAVEKLSAKVEALGNKIVYASGFLAAVVLLVGWYVKLHR